MDPLPPISDEFKNNFEKMFTSACTVCSAIRSFQPDVVLALMHSGWGPVFAAQKLWEQTQSVPFPPVACSNIGREKVNLFDDSYNMLSSKYFLGEYADEIEIGLYLAWIYHHKDWQACLYQQVMDALISENEPKKILVVDDFIQNGTTSILTVGLLELIFPQAKICILNARSWHHTDYAKLFFEIFHPIEELFPEGKAPSEWIDQNLHWAAVGSEDVAADSLDWRPISRECKAVLALENYGDPEEWISVSKTIYAMIADYVIKKAETYSPEPFDMGMNVLRYPQYYIFRDVWLNNGITRREMMQSYGLSRKEFDYFLDTWMRTENIILDGFGRSARYIIAPQMRQYMEGYGEKPAEDDGTFWLLPGKLLFGELFYWPGTNFDPKSRSKLRELIQSGIDCWIALEVIEDGQEPVGTAPFIEEANAAGVHVVVRQFSLALIGEDEKGCTRIRRPKRKEILPILEEIDSQLLQGRMVYVSTWEDDLRGIMAGCYLVRNGYAGSQALKQLAECRKDNPRWWKKIPASSKARLFIRRWPRGS